MADQSYMALVAAGLLIASSLMFVLWLLHLPSRNAGIVDIGWTAAVALLAVLYASLGAGWGPRRLAIALMMGIWGARLGIYLGRRVVGAPEDGRYRELRDNWGPRAPRRFFWFFQAQAFAAVFFALPALLASMHAAPAFHNVEIAAMLTWAIGLAGEASADRQLGRFKANSANRGLTCRSGLWRYSRHPNYFFEWLMWVAFALLALPAPWGVLAQACPLVMLYLLFRVTGIPATEAQAVRTRGDDYRRYQASTSVFVPWPPRSAARSAAR
jgi:steroid 5-alpha reductase family enzyme